MSSSNAPRPLAPALDPAATSRPAPLGSAFDDAHDSRSALSASRPGARQQMQHLTLLALSEDGTRILLGDDDGVEYTLDVTNALRSAVRGEQPRPGHLETRMDSALRPRDIQSRIRSGESAEAVAAAAGTSIEKIMPYAAPVLAERAHVAERAQKSSVRRLSPESGAGTARTLAEAVETQMRLYNTAPDSVEWDAYRREDGRWSLTGLYDTEARTGVATFIFDVPGNYVTLADDDARWLVGDLAHEAPATPEGDARRLASVPSTLGDDAIELVSTPEPAAPTATDSPAVLSPEAVIPPAAPAPALPPLAEDLTIDLTETVNSIRSAIRRPEAPADVTTTPTAPAEPEPVVEPEATPAVAPEAEAAPPAEAEESAPAPKKPAKRRGRASVPSWDEIMFGGGNE